MEIGVVLVTYNRLDKLKISLDCYEKQTVKPKTIIVVNNNSTDGTKEYLDEWNSKRSKIKKVVLNLEKNTGGSGGFYEGLKYSQTLELDWVWVADDDAFPNVDCFELLEKYYQKNKKQNIAALCGAVINRGKIDKMHRRRIKKGLFLIKQFTIGEKKYNEESFELDLFTYVGTLINAKKMKKAGITKKDYFIYYDDTDHSYRMRQTGKIICVPQAKIIHDGPISSMSDGVNWKYYYLIRNTLDFIRSNFGERYFKCYCVYIKIKNYMITTLLYKHKKEGYRLIRKAIIDAQNGVTGLDVYYKPGWKVVK